MSTDPCPLHSVTLESIPPPPRIVRWRFTSIWDIVHPLLLLARPIAILTLAMYYDLGVVLLTAAGAWFGQSVPAKITHCHPLAGFLTTHYSVHFTYQIDGTEFDASMGVNERSFRAVAPGDEVRVTLLPGWPRSASIADPALGASWGSLLWMWGLVLYAARESLAPLGYVLHMRSARALHRSGIPARARITKRERLWTLYPSVRLVYSYVTQAGLERESCAYASLGDPLYAADPGEELTILYDPSEPQSCILHGSDGWEIVRPIP